MGFRSRDERFGTLQAKKQPSALVQQNGLARNQEPVAIDQQRAPGRRHSLIQRDSWLADQKGTLRMERANGRHNGNEIDSESLGILDKAPPHDLDAEKAVLGSVMLDSFMLDEVSQLLTPQDFYRGDHQEIFQAMLDLHERANPIDSFSILKQVNKCRLAVGRDPTELEKEY